MSSGKLVPHFDPDSRRKRYSLANLIENMSPDLSVLEESDWKENVDEYPVFEIGGVSSENPEFSIWDLISGQEYGALVLFHYLYHNCGGDEMGELESDAEGRIRDEVKLSFENLSIIEHDSDVNAAIYHVCVRDLQLLFDVGLLTGLTTELTLRELSAAEFSAQSCELTNVGRYFVHLMDLS